MPATTFSRPALTRDFLLLLVVCFAAFFFQLGRLGLIDPDEPFYALTAREMVSSGDWLTPTIFGKPQFEKPIFYYWMAAGSFALFGESEFTGRLPTAISATVLVLLTYAFGSRLFNRRTGLIAGLYMATGLELCIMGRLMLTDIPMTIFVTAALFCYWLAWKEPQRRDSWIFWHMVFGGLAVLTKGPIGTLATLMTTLSFAVFTRQPFLLRGKGFWWGLLAYGVIVVPWYTLMLVKYGWAFVDEFFIRDNILRFLRAEHPANNHMWYYPGVFFVGSLPWLPGFFLAVRDLFTRAREEPSRLFVKAWFLSNLLFLTAAASKLPSYGFYLFVPVALMIAFSIERVLAGGFRGAGERRFFLGAAALQAIAASVAPMAPLARPFAVPILIFAAALWVVLVLGWMGRWRLWLGATALSSLLFVGAALTYSVETVERTVSVRPIARRMLADQKPGETLMAGKFAVRGIWFYTHQSVAVIANNARPFWADHPLTIIPAKKYLDDYLEENGLSALVAMRPPEWAKYHNFDGFEKTDIKEWYGQNLYIRASVPPKKAKKKKAPAQEAAGTF